MNTRPPVPKESEIQRSIKARLAVLGIVLWRRNVGAMRATHRGKERLVWFAEKGQSDLWGIDMGARHWEIETKRPGEVPTPDQLEWLEGMSDCGCVAFWADDPDIAERVARAVLDGGRIAWREDGSFDVEMQGTPGESGPMDPAGGTSPAAGE